MWRAPHVTGASRRSSSRSPPACSHSPRSSSVSRCGSGPRVRLMAVLLFRQFVDDDLGCASYLVGDSDAGVAVVVDPSLSIEQYLEAGVRIERVLETHTHADHVSS